MPSGDFSPSITEVFVSFEGFLEKTTASAAGVYLTSSGHQAGLSRRNIQGASILELAGSGTSTAEGVVAVVGVRLPPHRRVLAFHHTYDPPGYLGGSDEPYRYPQAWEVGEFMVSPWTFPWHAKSLDEMPPSLKISQLLLEVEEGYVFLLAVPSKGFAPYFTKPKGASLELVVTAGIKNNWRDLPLLAYATSDDPYTAVETVYEAVASYLGRACSLRTRKKFPDALGFLGWCTWNAFWRNLDEQRIVDGAREIMAKAPVRMVLIDDGWMTEENGMLKDFGEDRQKFPRGLAGVVESLKRNGVRSVGLWLTLNGYWNGVDPKSKLAESYRDELVEVGGQLAPNPENAYGFYIDWFKSIRAKGFDFVKVDNQYAVSTVYAESYPVELASRKLHEAVEAAAALCGLEVLNCMSLNPEHFFNWYRSSVVRASIDYSVPHSVSRSKLHIYFNAYNSIWLSQLAWPDWDMFQSYDPLALAHAVARALSGGPIYVTDEPGKTRSEVLSPLAFRDGRIPRLDGVGRPTRDTVMLDPYNEKVALKLENKLTIPGLGTYSLLGVFNIYKGHEDIEYSFKPVDLGVKDSEVVVYEFFTNTARKVSSLEEVRGVLEPDGVHLYVIAPLKRGVGVLGTRELYITPAVVDYAEDIEGGMAVHLRELRPIMLYLERGVLVNGEELTPGFHEIYPMRTVLGIKALQ